MVAWVERRMGDALVRAGGGALLYGAWLLGVVLSASIRRHGQQAPSGSDLLIGMMMFNLASLGAAALVLGKHLFDTIMVSDRWVARRG